jgi:hypothetical protein
MLQTREENESLLREKERLVSKLSMVDEQLSESEAELKKKVSPVP